MSKITWWGAAVTVTYSTAVAMYLDVSEVMALAPNELGDFLAGVFGPLAFFWLICGYLQQGIELRQNTEALSLQVRELKSAAQQQRELVLVTREHLQMERDEVVRLREAARIAALPVFSAKVGGYFRGDGDAQPSVRVANVGGDIRNAVVWTPYGLPSSVENFKAFEADLWRSGESHAASWIILATSDLEPFVFTISYTDFLGNPGAVNFAVSFEEIASMKPMRFKTSVTFKNPV